ncbi:MAG: hypothetical protein IE933_13310 [Sphingomonadales bacterium]|nr:hypothetical protein [Sphingomonadales bacterium]MBD3774956.1 hypothetical protein [Paracoccaceae bacterium]
MATAAAPRSLPAGQDTRFFTAMAFAMSAIILAGFSLNLVAGRSSFAVPAPYHVHALIFMGWIGLYCAQAVTAATGNWPLHARLGRLAYLWVPLMVLAGVIIMVVVARRTGGPFFFNRDEFLVSNFAGLLAFGWLAVWSLRQQRHRGWHRRLMLVAMSILTGPGIGRLLPMPLLIPYAWVISVGLTFAFPIIGMIVDKRRHGQVHPAYWWGISLYLGIFLASLALAYSPLGHAFSDWIVAGSPGAERPVEPYLPAGIGM